MAKIGFIEVDITADISHIRAGLASASSLIRDFSLLSIGLTSGINNAFKKISTIGIRSFQIGLIGITGTLVGATMEGSKFEDAMKRVFIMIGKGAQVASDDIEMLTDRAKELGRETLFSATEAAEGMVILGRAGFNTNQIFKAVTPILELAIATNIDMATTADMVVSSLYGFGVAVGKAGHMADVMATIVTSSNETMEDLSNTLSYIAPIASTVGMSVEETGAAIMMLANAGVRGSKAATGLRAAIAKMLSPTKSEKKLLEELGVSFITSTGELKDFDVIIGELGKKTISTADIFQLFGRRAATAISVLRRMGPGTFRKFVTDLENSEGATERMAEEMRKTFIGRVRDLMASLKLLGTTIYESYSRPLTDATFSLRNLIIAITSAVKENGTFKNIVKGILGLLDKYGISFEKMQKRIVEFIESLTPKKIASFFDLIKEKIDRAKKTVIDFVKIALEGIMESLPIGIKVAIEAVSNLVNWWSTLSDEAKTLIAKVVGVATAFLWLTGGLTPLILLFITLSSVIGSLVHIQIAAAVTKSLVYAKALIVLKMAAIGLVWILGAVGVAIAAWNIGKWIGNLKWFGDEFTTVYDKLTDFLTKSMAKWDIFTAHIRNAGYKIAEVIFDYVIDPMRTMMSALTGGRVQKLSEIMGLTALKEFGARELEAARAKYKYVEDMLAAEGQKRVEDRGIEGRRPSEVAGLDIERLRGEVVTEDVIRRMTEGVPELERVLTERAERLQKIYELMGKGWTVIFDNELKISGTVKGMEELQREMLKKLEGIERETGHYIGNQLPWQVD